MSLLQCNDQIYKQKTLEYVLNFFYAKIITVKNIQGYVIIKWKIKEDTQAHRMHNVPIIKLFLSNARGLKE